VTSQFPAIADHIFGEESNTFSNTLGDTIIVEVQADQAATASLLSTVCRSVISCFFIIQFIHTLACCQHNTCCLLPGYSSCSLKVTVEWLEFLIHIREVSDSILCPEICFPDVFVVFLSLSKKILVLYLKLGHDCFHPYPFQFIIHSLIILSFCAV
jgi:hypothetical protein